MKRLVEDDPGPDIISQLGSIGKPNHLKSESPYSFTWF